MPADQATEKPTTYTLPFVNGGMAFDFGPERVTPYAARASAAQRTAALKDALRAVEFAGLPPLAVDALVKSAEAEAGLAQAQGLLFWSLVAVDGKVKDLTQDGVMQRLTMPQFKALMPMLNREDTKPSPLGETRTTSASS